MSTRSCTYFISELPRNEPVRMYFNQGCVVAICTASVPEVSEVVTGTHFVPLYPLTHRACFRTMGANAPVAFLRRFGAMARARVGMGWRQAARAVWLGTSSDGRAAPLAWSRC